jgi:hypothetical protein
MHWYLIWDAQLQRDRKLFIPTTLDGQQFCVRAVSGRQISHDVFLKFWTVEQFLGMGAPCEISDAHFSDMITQDEYRILFGSPQGTAGDRVLQDMVYSLKKEEEKLEWDRLEIQVEELKEELDSDDDVDDQKSYLAAIADMELRIARLSKEPVGSGWHLDPIATGLGDQTIWGLYWPDDSDNVLYNATTIWPVISGIFQI